MTSLRTRALAGGVLWGLITVVLGFVGLASYLNSQSDARFDALLQTWHTQALVAVANNAAFPDNFGCIIGDPIYQRPFSGQYWQIQSSDGQLFVSPSLVDTLLPQADPAQTELVRRKAAGPADDLVLSISQWLSLDDGSRWHVQVASSYDALDRETALLRRSLFSAFGIVAITGLIGALALVRAVLKPLDALRAEVAARWEHEDGLYPQDYPIEVVPLVTDINSLLERNRETLRSSRRQAADLAHAIKTPSAIMRNELSRLQSEGLAVGEAFEALDRLDAQLKRSFARLRAEGTDASISTFTDLDDALGRMQRAFGALARNSDKAFAADVTPDLRVRMDKSDLEEVIGNLLDNALKWSRGRFEMTAHLTS
ncbi:MAG: signal transduction histidine kinase, partial [Yoonia sp.]